jgi:E3 ubiquitin-protein ligase SHPRH
MIQKSKDTIEEAQVLLANLKLRNGGMHELQLEGWDIPLMMYMEWLPHVEEQVKTHGTKVTEARHANELNRQQQSSNSGDSDSNKDSKILKALLAAHTTWQNILHRYYFYIAGVYHMLDNKEKEDEYYDKAADTRRQILARPQEKV